MCSTPKGSGSTCQARRFVDDNPDYAAYSKMLRRASARIDQRDAQRKRQTETNENAEVASEEIESKS